MLEVAVQPGQLDAFRALMTEMVDSTRAEPGALSYEWFVSDDGGVVHLCERYADVDATLAHLRAFGEQSPARLPQVPYADTDAWTSYRMNCP